MKRIPCACVVLLCAYLLAGCSDGTESSKGKKGKERRGISAIQLHADYKGNSIAAEREYTNRTIEVWGKVHQVRKADDGGSTVSLSSEELILTTGVWCHFAPKYNEAIISLRAGDVLSLRGKCLGFENDEVIMDLCEPID